jgi:outer membrane protein
MGDLDTAEQEETAIRKQLGLVKKRYEQGLDPETSLYDAQSRYDLQKASLSVSASALQIAYRQLATVTGVYDTNIARISEELKILPPLPATGEEWVQLALAHNVNLEVARHSVDAAENEYKKQRAGHLPRLDLYAGYKESENDGGQGFAPASKASVIGVELTIPLYQGGMVSASRKRALYSHQEAKDRLTHQRWMVESNALNLHLTVVSDVQRFEAQERAIGSSRNAYRSTLKSYENGISMIRDVLSAQRVLFNAQRDLAHTRLDYIMNTLKLKQAAGTLTIEDLVALNKSMEYRDGG